MTIDYKLKVMADTAGKEAEDTPITWMGGVGGGGGTWQHH